MLPFDLLGGSLLTLRFGRSSVTLGSGFIRWLVGVPRQTLLFLLTSITILAAGRLAGLPGSILVTTMIAICYAALQRKLAVSIFKGQWCVAFVVQAGSASCRKLVCLEPRTDDRLPS